MNLHVGNLDNANLTDEAKVLGSQDGRAVSLRKDRLYDAAGVFTARRASVKKMSYPNVTYLSSCAEPEERTQGLGLA